MYIRADRMVDPAPNPMLGLSRSHFSMVGISLQCSGSSGDSVMRSDEKESVVEPECRRYATPPSNRHAYVSLVNGPLSTECSPVILPS
jgi:hypothetical protein